MMGTDEQIIQKAITILSVEARDALLAAAGRWVEEGREPATTFEMAIELHREGRRVDEIHEDERRYELELEQLENAFFA